MTAEQYASDVSFQDYCLKTNKEAIEYWTSYQAVHPEQVPNMEEAKKIVELLTLQISEKEIRVEKAKIKPRFNEKIITTKEKTPSARNTSYRTAILNIAAIGLLLIVAGYFFGLGNYSSKNSGYVTRTGVVPTNVALSDGSSIFLAAGASIKYASTWKEKNKREIWLTGKAFFNVRKNPPGGQQTFWVHTQKGRVEVLGTTFTIDDQEENFEVVLESGKLAFFGQQQESVLLTPGEKLFYQDGQLKKQKVNPAHYLMWKEEQLVFEDTPVGEIVAVLEASFDLNIRVENEQLLKRKVTASIPKNDPELLLQALSEIYDIRIIRSDGEITLK